MTEIISMEMAAQAIVQSKQTGDVSPTLREEAHA